VMTDVIGVGKADAGSAPDGGGRHD
jgi:hypothetical protein